MADGGSAERRALFISIRPNYVDALVAGTKTVELRRTRPDVVRGDRVLIYSSSPVMSLLATAVVDGVSVARPSEIWTRFRDEVGVSRREFDEYFVGAASASAIELRDVSLLPEAVDLAELRRRWRGFHPPQAFRYVSAAQAARLAEHRPRSE